jgi:hypothetical protein
MIVFVFAKNMLKKLMIMILVKTTEHINIWDEILCYNNSIFSFYIKIRVSVKFFFSFFFFLQFKIRAVGKHQDDARFRALKIPMLMDTLMISTSSSYSLTWASSVEMKYTSDVDWISHDENHFKIYDFFVFPSKKWKKKKFFWLL